MEITATTVILFVLYKFPDAAREYDLICTRSPRLGNPQSLALSNLDVTYGSSSQPISMNSHRPIASPIIHPPPISTSVIGLDAKHSAHVAAQLDVRSELK